MLWWYSNQTLSVWADLMATWPPSEGNHLICLNNGEKSKFFSSNQVDYFFLLLLSIFGSNFFFSSERWRRLVSSFFRFKVSTWRRVGHVGVAPSCCGGRAADHARGELSLGRRSFVWWFSHFFLSRRKKSVFWRSLKNVCLKNVSYDLFVLTRPSIIVRLVWSAAS